VCLDCRAAFQQEQSLFSSIDSGLGAVANSDVPASLLPRVRAGLDEAARTQRRWFQPWIFAAASVALGLAVFQFTRPQHSRLDNQAKQTPQVPISEAPGKNAGPQISRLAAQIVSSNTNKQQTPAHSTLLRLVASSQPEVLVPADEREAFARFVATLRERSDVAVALATPALPTKGEPGDLKPLQINGLEIKPLEGTESEQSDGTEQKR
jgi:hypothetical protein